MEFPLLLVRLEGVDLQPLRIDVHLGHSRGDVPEEHGVGYHILRRHLRYDEVSGA